MLGLFTEEEMETKEERDARLNKQELEEVSATFWMFPFIYTFEVLSKHKKSKWDTKSILAKVIYKLI